MAAKLTLADVKAHGKKNGYEVLSRVYLNNGSKLDIRWVKCGHKSQSPYSSLQQGHGCRECNKGRQFDIGIVHRFGSKRGFLLLDSHLVDGERIVRIRWGACSHEESKTWKTLKKGRGCGTCAGRGHAGALHMIKKIREHARESGYEVLTADSDYTGGKNKLEVRWASCGHEERKPWSDLQSGRKCGVCRKVTTERIVDRGRDLGYTLLAPGPWTSTTKIGIQWDKCGHKERPTWEFLNTRQGCHTCAPTRRRTVDDVVALGKVRGYTLLSKDYQNSSSLLEIEWNKCGHKESKLLPSLRRSGCGVCAGGNYTIEDVKVHGEESGYTVLSKKYVNSETKIDIRWKKCGHKDSKIWGSLRCGNGCVICRVVTLSVVKERGKQLGNDGYDVLSTEYVDNATKLDIQWRKCGHKDSKIWGSIQQGTGCWCNHGWSKSRVADIIMSMGPFLSQLSTAERQIILEKGRQLEGLKKSIQRSIIRGDFFEDGKAPQEKSEVEKRLDAILGISTQLDDIGEGDEDLSALRRSVDVLSGESGPVADEDSYEGLPPAAIEKRLNAFDEGVSSLTDPEAVEELVNLRADQMWNAALNNIATVRSIKAARSTGFGKEVRDRFVKEFQAVTSLPIPAGFRFPHQPTLMQRLCAYRVQTNKRYGNWSGMGSGKTGGAALTSRVIKAKLTVIVCPNSLAELENGTSQWGREIQRWFPNTEVQTKTWTPEWRGLPPRYLILNHEMFQQPKTMENIQTFLAENIVDFIGIDEVQMVKQRSDEASRRRRNLSFFIAEVERRNPDFHLLTMSGTPVINVLREAVSQIELVQGVTRSELPIAATASNCLKINRELVKVGFRQRINYKTGVTTKEIEVDCASAIPALQALGPTPNPVEREEILTRLKLPVIMKHLKKGEPTLIYTHYVGADDDGSSIVDMLVKATKKKGLTVGVYTGADKSGKAPFMAGKLDVLVASSAIATGVDGLQNVCHKLIINVLPWTNADLSQLIARLVRTGQKKGVQVIIPVTTTVISGQERSWCRRILSILKYKKTVADAAVDGVWPEGELENVESAWKNWLESLGEVEERKAA